MQRRVKRSTKLKAKKALQTATTCELQAEKENATRMISDGVSFPIGFTFSSLRKASLIDSSFEVKEEDIESYKPLGHWISLDHTGELSNSTRGSVEL